jgi:hypothetical protein
VLAIEAGAADPVAAALAPPGPTLRAIPEENESLSSEILISRVRERHGVVS